MPVDLWRGLKESRLEELNGDIDSARHESLNPRIVALTQDNKIAFTSVDVKIEARNGVSWVLGCTTMRAGGNHWGISLFDRIPSYAEKGGWKHLKLPSGTAIPECLVITQDTVKAGNSNHYTIAPKWDMTLGLYMQWLAALAKRITLWVAK